MSDKDPIIRMFTDALSVMEDGQLVHDLTETRQERVAAFNDAVERVAGKAWRGRRGGDTGLPVFVGHPEGA